MPPKRQRVTLEVPSAGQAALPAVCYVPSIPEAGDAAIDSCASSGATFLSPAKRLKFNVHAKQRLGTYVQLVHASGGEIEYVGRSDGDENAGVQPCCYALGVFHPGADKLQLVSVAGDRIFRLDTRLPGLVYAPTGAGADEDDNARERRKMAAKRLVDEFGSTRRRRQLTAREAGMVVADKISGGEEVKEMLSSVAARGEEGGLTREEVARRAFAQRTMPPHNPAATTPEEAYPLELLLGRVTSTATTGGPGAGLAGPGEEAGAGGGGEALAAELHVGQIHKLAEDEEELAKAREKELVHPYVLSRLGPLRSLKSDDDPVSRARVRQRARYLALLAALLRVHSKPVLVPGGEGAVDAGRQLRVRDGLADLFLERFYVKSEDMVRGLRYVRTDAQKQMLLSYILAVAMVVEGGYMEREQFEELRVGLKMDASKLAGALQQLGASTKATKLKLERSGATVEVPAYTVSLLRRSGPHVRTLGECFPVIKLARAKSKGR